MRGSLLLAASCCWTTFCRSATKDDLRPDALSIGGMPAAEPAVLMDDDKLRNCLIGEEGGGGGVIGGVTKCSVV